MVDRSLIMLCSIFFIIKLMVVFSLSLMDKQKFSPSWRRLWIACGIVLEDKFTNHLSLRSIFEAWGKIKIEGPMTMSKEVEDGEWGIIGLKENVDFTGFVMDYFLIHIQNFKILIIFLLANLCFMWLINSTYCNCKIKY